MEWGGKGCHGCYFLLLRACSFGVGERRVSPHHAMKLLQCENHIRRYLVGSTIILGKLGCIVCSKILGIGTAERNWKQIKAVKAGQRAALGAEKCKNFDSDVE